MAVKQRKSRKVRGSEMKTLGEKLQKDLRKAKRALRLADSIMAYCGGDRWERECTEPDRVKYSKLYKELFGEESEA